MFEYQPTLFRFVMEWFIIFYIIFFATFLTRDVTNWSDVGLRFAFIEAASYSVLGSVITWGILNPPLWYILAPFLSGACAYAVCTIMAVSSPSTGGSDIEF